MNRMVIVEKLVRDNLVRNHGAEIGVWKGETTLYLLEHLPKLRLLCVDPYKVYDHYKKHHHLGVYEDQLLLNELYEAVKGKVERRHRNRTAWVREASVDAASAVPPEDLDFVFIDGNHGHEYVLADIKAWAPKVRKGGYIIGHDYYSNKDSKECVKRAVEAVFGSDYKVIDSCWFHVKQ